MKKTLTTIFVFALLAVVAMAGKPLFAALSTVDGNLFEKGTRLVKQQKMAEAVKVFELLHQRQPLKFGTYYFLANLYHQVDRHEDVIAIYKKAQKRFPFEIRKISKPGKKNFTYSQLLFVTGDAYFNLQKLDDSIAVFKKILKSHNYKKSNSSWVRFHSKTPDTVDEFYASVHYSLGAAYNAKGDKKAAMKQYRKLEKLDKEKSESLLKLINY
jgi:tetratricopeptide (TPR) repeat protein